MLVLCSVSVNRLVAREGHDMTIEVENFFRFSSSLVSSPP